MKYFFILFAGLIINSCAVNDSREEKTTNKISSPDSNIGKMSLTSLPGCYRMIIDKDSAQLKLDINGVFAKGTLDYNRFEKDDNEGNFEGTVENNIIKAWYTYKSEGIISVKEIFFKIDNNKIEEGYGDMDLRNDTAYFKYPMTLKYEGNHPYIKVDCDN